MLRKSIILGACLLISVSVLAQTNSWTLEQCIDYARENSLTMKQANYAIQNAELTALQNKMQRVPTLNGNVRGGLQFGRTIDPTTNSFDNQTIGYNSFSLNLNWFLFDGLRIQNQVAQGALDQEAAKYDADATFNTMALNISAAYLQVLLAEEQLENTRRQLEQSTAQLNQIDKLINAGSLPENDRLDVLAQIALNEQTLVQGENLVASSYLRLKQLLELDPNIDLKVVKPNFDIPVDANPEAMSANEVYSTALGVQPQIKAGDLRLLSAEKDVNIARSAGLPSLSFFAQLSTNFSSVGRTTDGTVMNFFPVDVRTPDGMITTLELGQEQPVFIDQAYFDQLNENFGQGVGLNLSIPIFNGLSTKINTERAELNVLNTKVTNDLVKQQLKTDVMTAVTDARASKKSYEAAERALDASDAAYQNAQRRFDLGAINTFELTSAKIARDQAEIERTRSKFQYLFNLKIVDFYLGKELKMD